MTTGRGGGHPHRWRRPRAVLAALGVLTALATAAPAAADTRSALHPTRRDGAATMTSAPETGPSSAPVPSGPASADPAAPAPDTPINPEGDPSEPVPPTEPGPPPPPGSWDPTAPTFPLPSTGPPSGARRSAGGLDCADLFGPAETALLEAAYSGHHLTAAVFDERTGCWYDFAPQHRDTTASVFKIAMMGLVLLHAQDAGRLLTAQEDALIWPMITRSDDAATTALFNMYGGPAGINAFYARVGMNGTYTASDKWGADTRTPARDQAELVRQLLGDRTDTFSAYSRAAALHYMTSVIPSQQWGIGAGRPPDWSFANKNGFYPAACCAWRINTVGRVWSPAGYGLELAILSDGWSTQAQGVAAVEDLARRANARLAVAPPIRGALGSSGPVAMNADGRLEAFGVSAAGGLQADYQLAVGQGWSGWLPHSGAWPTSQPPSVSRNADGRLETFALLADGTVVNSWQLPVGQGWSGPSPLGRSMAWGPAAARDLDGRLEVFAVGLDGQLWHVWQTSPGAGWAAWAPLGGSFAAAPAVGTTLDGRLAVAGVSAAGALQVAYQTTPNGSWSPLITVGGGAAGRPALAHNADGRLEIAVLGTDHRMLHTWQQSGGWAPLVAFSDQVFGQPPALRANADGRLEVFGTTASGHLLHQWQSRPNVSWDPPADLGTGVAGPPSLIDNHDGRLEVFALAATGALVHAYQLAPDSAWSAVTSLGGALAVG